MIPNARGRTLQVVVSVYQCLSTLAEQEKRRAVLVRSGVIGQPPGLSSPVDKAPLGHPGRRPPDDSAQTPADLHAWLQEVRT